MSAHAAAPRARPNRPPPGRLPRLIPPGGPLDLAGHLDAHGPMPRPGGRGHGGGLIASVEQAGLTGRGGAAFPVARKMRSVAAASARLALPGRRRGAVVVANGAESEPASGKDAMLLARAPHLVLDGIALAAAAVAADRAFVCAHPGTVAGLTSAVAERERAGLDAAPVQVVAVPAGYTASEETSLVNLLNGGPARPMFTPPRPFQRGVGGRPTLVHNVETLAHLALIARHGPDWFAAIGAPGAPGSALVTIGGAVRRPGVYEIALGARLGDLLGLAGGLAEPAQAVLAGGYFGAWLPMPEALDTPATDRDLRSAGAALGSGALIALPGSACGLAETARVARYLAGQSAGQCGPCVNGLPALAGALGHLAFDGGDPAALAWLERLPALVSGRGACHFPDGAARLAASAARVFQDDLLRHRRHGPCARADRAGTLPVPGGSGP